MRSMDHAEAHELLADLALEPANIEIPAETEEHERLRLHLETCEICRTDLEAWRNTHGAIEEALVTADGGRERLADAIAEPVIAPPPSLRAAIASIPARTQAQPATQPPIPAPAPARHARPLLPAASAGVARRRSWLRRQ